jgi:hypothetical protein
LLRHWAGEARRWLALRWRRLPRGLRSPANLALGSALTLLLLALLLLLLLERTPGSYRDLATMTDEELIRWGEGFVKKANDVVTHVVNQERFDVTITEEELNGYLAGFFRPGVREALPARLSEQYTVELPRGLGQPMVHLGEGEVVVMARYEGSRFRPVVSVAGVPELDGEGNIRFRPTRCRAGYLPLPTEWVPGLAEQEGRSISLAKEHIRLERVEVREGQLHLVGSYEPSSGRPSPPAR